MRKAFVDDVVDYRESTSIAVAGEVTVYTKAFKLAFGEYFGIRYRGVSASGDPNLKIELEESDVVPTSEGVADSNYVEPENMADIESALTTETWHIKSLTPVPMPYGRFKITGNSGNPSDTIVNIKLVQQEDL